MARLKDLRSATIAERRYIDKCFIYVESSEDVQFLQHRWFNDQAETIEFLSAGDDEGGGCVRVVSRVQQDREAGIRAFGLVDRDALAGALKWTEFFDPDDARFDAAIPFGPHVKVLRCWEIENYLLHPEIVEEFLADELGRAQRAFGQVIEELFEILCRLIPLIAADLVLSSNGKKTSPEGFGLGGTLAQIDELVRSRIENDLSLGNIAQMDQVLEKLVAFSANTAPRSLDHWLNQLRVIDGKRLIRWIKHEHKLRDRDIRWHLARLTRDRGKIASELWQMLDDFRAQAS